MHTSLSELRTHSSSWHSWQSQEASGPRTQSCAQLLKMKLKNRTKITRAWMHDVNANPDQSKINSSVKIHIIFQKIMSYFKAGSWRPKLRMGDQDDDWGVIHSEMCACRSPCGGGIGWRMYRILFTSTPTLPRRGGGGWKPCRYWELAVFNLLKLAALCYKPKNGIWQLIAG